MSSLLVGLPLEVPGATLNRRRSVSRVACLHAATSAA